MTHTFKRTVAALLAVFTVLGALSVAMPTNAQAPTGSGLRISPTRNDLSIVPGDSREITQTVRNVTQNPVTVRPALTDFESNNLDGTPNLVGDESQVSAYSLREFLTLPDPFDLNPEEEREVTIRIEVPSNASPGAYFGSILYRASPLGQSGDGQVALVASVGSLILLEVPGDITEKIDIKDISAYIGDSAGSIFTKKPDSVGVLIENLGNSFSQPFGKVSVQDWRGNEIFLYELNDNTPRANILPASTRLFKNDLSNVEVRTVNGEEVVEKTSPLKWPGRYSVVGNISHGSTGEIFTVESSFWYIPLWLIITLAVVLVVLVIGAYYLYRKYVSKATKRKK
jgi:hypothetical protein